MSETILIVLGAAGFLAIGAGLGYGLAQLRRRGENARADEVRQEFDEYQREVTQHFGRTAEHFRAIGREYRDLYEHMASGADALCDRDAADVKLSFAPKAILESIAEEQPESPEARDFAADEDAVADTAAEAGPQLADEAIEGEPKEAQPDPESGEPPGRTLH